MAMKMREVNSDHADALKAKTAKIMAMNTAMTKGRTRRMRRRKMTKTLGWMMIWAWMRTPTSLTMIGLMESNLLTTLCWIQTDFIKLS